MKRKLSDKVLEINHPSGRLCVGVDECGLGCILSRVYGAACILPPDFKLPSDGSVIIRDSKKMNAEQIRVAAKYIKEHALDWAIAWESEKTIDSLPKTIKDAKFKAWKNALDHLKVKFEMILVDGPLFDGYKRGEEEVPYETIIRGDDTYLTIASSAILAKNARDDYIKNVLCVRYPELKERYSIHTNVGYATPDHKAGLEKYGASQFHRKSCKDVADKPLKRVRRYYEQEETVDVDEIDILN